MTESNKTSRDPSRVGLCGDCLYAQQIESVRGSIFYLQKENQKENGTDLFSTPKWGAYPLTRVRLTGELGLPLHAKVNLVKCDERPVRSHFGDSSHVVDQRGVTDGV